MSAARFEVLLARGTARFEVLLARGTARFEVLLARGTARFDARPRARERRLVALLSLLIGVGVAIPLPAGLPLAVGLAQAEAPAAAPASVLVILGSSVGTGSDAALAKLEALRKPPFDSFTKKSLLKRVDVQLSQGKEAEVELPNGRKLRLALLERAADGRFRVSVSINRPGKQDYLPLMTVVAAPGDPFFVVGQKHEGGTLIIGVSIGKPS